jgi:predicted DNA-binding transcriptional regulator AlpA
MADAIFSRPEPPDRLLTAQEAAPILRMSPATLYRKADRLPFAQREGGLVRFSARGVQEHIRRAKK